MLTFALGNMTVTEICDIRSFEIPLATIFPQSDPRELQTHLHWLEPDFLAQDNVRLVVRSWLLKRNGRNILVDACVGNYKQRPVRPDWHERNDSYWTDTLADCGLQPEDIDIVFCTHLHADHVGWNTKLDNGKWVPTFPNARYVTSRTEYDHWEAETAASELPIGHGCFEDSVLPVMEFGQMDLIAEDFELAEGLVLKSSPGHTPGHMSIEASCENQVGIFCGDAIHSPVQMIQPDWSSAFCSDPIQARQTRLNLLESLCDTSRLLIPMHFGGSGRCQVLRHCDAFLPDFLENSVR
jgi:glyoxylase-like metal-dependent hydrolase (beta-lactamase superfamily II)